MKKVLTIAGSDCSGGAGIQADLKTFAAHGTYGMSVITSVVAENTTRVIDIQDITADIIKKQIDAIFEDIEVDAIKIGMLSKSESMIAVAEKIKQYKPNNIVIDTVMYSKDNTALMNEKDIDLFINTLAPLADIITPNIPEAQRISQIKIDDISDMKKACEIIHKLGCKSVLVKGGHYKGGANDVLFDGKNFHLFLSKRIDTKNTHGTGCTLSSAIAANLAKGENIVTAVENAKHYITKAIENSLEIGKGNGPLGHFYERN